MSKQVRIIMAIVAAILIIIVFILLFAQSNLHRDSAQSLAAGKVPALGPKAARTTVGDFTLHLDGKDLSVHEFRGRVVYLNFWASWCEPCLTELPLIQELQKSYGPDQFEAILINLDHNSADRHKAQELQRSLAPEVLSSQSDGKKLQDLFHIEQLPFHIVMDKNGKIATAFYGPLEKSLNEFKGVIESLFSELGEF